MECKVISKRRFRLKTAVFLLIAILVINYSYVGVIDAYAEVSLPTGSVIGDAGQSFINNKGLYTDWNNPSSGFSVDSEYSYRLSETSSTSYKIIGQQSYDAGIQVATNLGHISSSVRDCAIFNVNSSSSSVPGGIGFTATNLKIWNSQKRSYDYVDMRVTVSSWDNSKGSNNYIYIRKNPDTTVYITDIKEAKLRFDYFIAGTDKKYTLKGNLTYADIDDRQYIGFYNKDTINQYVASNSLLNYSISNGQSIYYRDGGSDSTNTPRLAAGMTFETTGLDILFGHGNARTKVSEWAMFKQFNNSMGAIEPSDPYKKVSDGDEADKEENTLVDVEESFVYKVSQRIPAGLSSEMYYKSLIIEDEIDSCLKINDVRVVQGTGTDRNGWFDIKIDGNKVTATALSETLKNAQFYGGSEKEDSVITLEIDCVLDPDKSDADLKNHGHFNQNDNDWSLDNKGVVTINDTPRNTNEVVTKLGSPDLIIKKDVSSYEFQVGEKIDYTISVSHSENSAANAIGVILKDTDLPDGLLLDDSTLVVSGVNSQNSFEITPGGFVFNAERLDKGEEFIISFSATPEKEVNGQIITNTASVIARNISEEIFDDATVYINSPKLKISKTSDKNDIKAKDIVTYALALEQVNPGTFMRDVRIEDTLQEQGVKLHDDSIEIYNSEDKNITKDCDIVVSGNAFSVVPHLDMVHEDMSAPPKDLGMLEYESLKPESKLTIIYDVSVDENFAKSKDETIYNHVTSPATENTNGVKIVDNPDIPSGGDETNHEIAGLMEKEVVEKESVDTGDKFNPLLLALIIGISGILLCVFWVLRKSFISN